LPAVTHTASILRVDSDRGVRANDPHGLFVLAAAGSSRIHPDEISGHQALLREAHSFANATNRADSDAVRRGWTIDLSLDALANGSARFLPRFAGSLHNQSRVINRYKRFVSMALILLCTSLCCLPAKKEVTFEVWWAGGMQSMMSGRL
jgi:hypothetical protein